MSTWSDMNAVQRNHLIGELIGAKQASQCYLAVDGQRVLVTPYAEAEIGKVDALLVALRASDDMWENFLRANSHAAPDWREKLTVDVERWHIAYSNTPGGAWFVVEWLREQGFEVTIDVFGKNAESPYSAWAGDVCAGAKTMPDAVCELLLNIKAPEVLA